MRRLRSIGKGLDGAVIRSADQRPVGFCGVTEVLRSLLAAGLLDCALLPAVPVPGGNVLDDAPAEPP
jgi:hypothetical protein